MWLLTVTFFASAFCGMVAVVMAARAGEARREGDREAAGRFLVGSAGLAAAASSGLWLVSVWTA